MIAKMKKVYLIAHTSFKSELVDALQKQGLLHITDLKEKISQTELKEFIQEFEPDVESYELLLSKIKFVLDFIARFEERKKSFLEGLVKEKIEVKETRFEKIEGQLNLEDVYCECKDIEAKLLDLDNKRKSLETLGEELLPWTRLSLKLAEMRETAHVVMFLGQVPAQLFAKMQIDLADNCPESFIKVLSEDSQSTNLLLVYHKDASNEVNSILHKYTFSPVSFSNLSGTPKQEIANIDIQRAETEKEQLELLQTAKKFATLESDLLILQDFFENKKKRQEIEASFAHTRATFMIEGWICKADISQFQTLVESISEEIVVSYLDPTLEEKPPVVLENRKWIKPFEMITKLYGLPQYSELDPTPYLAPFFIIFFGLCIGDVGYGAALILICWWLKKKMPFGEEAKNFFQLLIYGGFSTMIAGIITGSWFAIPNDSLPRFLKSLMLFDPLKQPIIFLLLAIALGFFQLWFGVALEMIDNLRTRKISDAVFDQGSVLIFLPGAALLIARLFITAKPPFWNPVDIWLAVIGAGMIILFHNRANKNIFGRVFGGVYSLYGMMSFLGDTISYARLMALGLATVLIGFAINILGEMAFSRVPFVGIVLMVVILVGGHLFNLVINLLGAFIHPARLQYVEFFTKFYEDGGRKFEPFAIETKNLVIK